MSRIATLVLGGALAFSAGAAFAADPRMQTLTYAQDEVYRLTGSTRAALQIVFGEGEAIEQVALGDGEAWEAAAEGSVLFLRPLKVAKPTNLLVSTRKGQASRHYAFELTSRAGDLAGPGAVFQVRFRYPDDEKALLDAALAAQARNLEGQILNLQLQGAILEGPRNLAYRRQGALSLAPSEITDNGRFTLLRFPANQALPAIYAVDEAGVESLTPFDVRGEFVVIHGVHRQLRLRRGRQVLCLSNDAFDPFGRNPGHGSASSEVQRTLRHEARPQ